MYNKMLVFYTVLAVQDNVTRSVGTVNCIHMDGNACPAGSSKQQRDTECM